MTSKDRTALEGIRVLDLSQFTPGPMCAQILGDLGAEVIKIERPGGNDERRTPPIANNFGVYFALNNRDKRSITLNLKAPAGQELLRRLVAKSDVLVENFRPGYLDSLGLGYAALSKLRPELILVSVTGFGQTGPYRDRGGFDMIAQAVGGLMSLNGEPEGPPLKTGTSVAGVVTGLNSVIGVLAALRHREKTGEGQWVDVALLDSAVSQIESDIPYYALTGEKLPRVGNRRLLSAPSNIFRASDGYVYIAPGIDSIWRKLCQVMGCPEFGEHPDFATNPARIERVDQTEKIVQAWVNDKRVDEIVGALAKAGVPCGPVNDVASVIDDPQVRERGMIVTARHPKVGDVLVPGQPIRLSKTPARAGSAIAEPGQHNASVYQELLGASDSQLTGWVSAGVI